MLRYTAKFSIRPQPAKPRHIYSCSSLRFILHIYIYIRVAAFTFWYSFEVYIVIGIYYIPTYIRVLPSRTCWT